MEDNTKLDHKEIGWVVGGVDVINQVYGRHNWGTVENMAMNVGVRQRVVNFSRRRRTCVVKKGFAPWIYLDDWLVG